MWVFAIPKWSQKYIAPLKMVPFTLFPPSAKLKLSKINSVASSADGYGLPTNLSTLPVGFWAVTFFVKGIVISPLFGFPLNT